MRLPADAPPVAASNEPTGGAMFTQKPEYLVALTVALAVSTVVAFVAMFHAIDGMNIYW